MLGRLGSRALVTTAAALAVLTPGIAHAGTWLQPPVPVNLSNGETPSAAIDGTGNAVVVWQAAPAPPTFNIQGARHVVGTPGFGQLPDFSSDTGLVVNSQPLVVTNRNGDGLVVWVRSAVPASNQIDVRTIAPNGSASATVVSLPTVATPMPLDLPVAAINANGDAVIAWEQGSDIEAVTRQGLSGSFSSPQTISSGSSAEPTAAIDAAGNAIVAWQDGTPSAISAAIAPHGGAFGAEQSVTPIVGHSYTQPAIGANPIGQMVLAFQDAGASSTVVSAVTGTVSGGFGANPTVTTLSGDGVNGGPSVTVDDPGDAAVAWKTASAVQVSQRVAGGSFPTPAQVETVSPAGITPDSVALAGNGEGDLVATWYTFDVGPMKNVVQAAARPHGASGFESAKVISDTSNDAGAPVAVLDENGDALVAFPLGNGGTPQGVSTAAYDGAGPLLGAPTGPSSVTQGAPATFSIPQPKDAFSNVASVSWSFGDGSAAVTGTQVTHTFTKTGSFTVTVTATDAVGNKSSATLHVTVGPGGPNRQPCVVPKLKGKSLSKAKNLLTKAHCALGKVTKPKKRKHHKLGKLVVKSSSPKAGSSKPAGTKVNLTLTKAPKKHTRGR
jgi:hypothetical protein